MYRKRLDQRTVGDAEQIELARLFKRVFGTAEGNLVLDHIVNEMCRVDDVLLSADPHVIVDANARRNVGITIARLVLSPLEDQEKPEVKT